MLSQESKEIQQTNATKSAHVETGASVNVPYLSTVTKLKLIASVSLHGEA
jgi:hypothetical protein